MEPLFALLELVRDVVPHGAPFNMGADEWLLRQATVPVLRVYRWERRAVSFGFAQRWREVQLAWPGCEPVRRWTGGGTVLHGADWTYSLIVPATEPVARVRAAAGYALIHARLAAALRGAGVAAQLAPQRAQPPGGACFQNPVAHDVLVDGRKIAGAAQRRTRQGMLHQGSVQGVTLPDDFDLSLAQTLGRELTVRGLADAEAAGAELLARERYATAAWLERH